MTTRARRSGGDDVEEQIDAAMLAVQALVAIAAQSVGAVEDRATLPQLRVLVLLSSRGPMNLNALAEAMGVHPSNATRACDRLVAAGLLQRRESPVDRRNLILELTDEGTDLIAALARSRRASVRAVLAKLPEPRRRAVVAALRSFGLAAGESLPADAWKLGWPG